MTAVLIAGQWWWVDDNTGEKVRVLSPEEMSQQGSPVQTSAPLEEVASVAGTEPEIRLGTPTNETLRWVEPTAKKPGHWEIKEVAFGQDRWRPATEAEFRANSWAVLPGPFSDTEIGRLFSEGPFGEVAPTGEGGGGGAAPAFKLSNEQTLQRIRLGLTVAEAEAALQAGSTMEAYASEKNFAELNEALTRGHISAGDFAFVMEMGTRYGVWLTASDVRDANMWGIPLEQYGGAMASGLERGDIAESVQLGVPLGDFLWARQQGLTNGDIRDAKISGVPLAQRVVDIRMEAIAQEAEAEFSTEWAKTTKSFSPEVLASPGFTRWLDNRAVELQTDFVTRRTQQMQPAVRAEITGQTTGAIPPGMIPLVGGGYYDPTKQTYEAVIPEPAPEPEPVKMPSADQLILQARGAGVVPVSAAGPGPLGAGGISVWGGPLKTLPPPPATTHLTPFGGEVFRAELGRAYAEGRATPSAQFQEQNPEWRQRVQQRYGPLAVRLPTPAPIEAGPAPPRRRKKEEERTNPLARPTVVHI